MLRTRRFAGAFLLVFAVGVGASGCSTGDDVDDVLWRQIIMHKDELGTKAPMWDDKPPEEVADAIKRLESGFPGLFGASDVHDLGLENGGMVLHNLAQSEQLVEFDVLISSGPRNVAADPFAGDEPYTAPYFGPDAIYTCYSMALSTDGDGWSYGKSGRCAEALTDGLGGAEGVDISEFAG